jgi:hypothetical protein
VTYPKLVCTALVEKQIPEQAHMIVHRGHFVDRIRP